MYFFKKLSKSLSDISSNFKSNQAPSRKLQPVSLVNIGANCYLNAALQSISSCEKFYEDIKHLNATYRNLEKLSLFYKLMDTLRNGSNLRLEISRNLIFKNWNKIGQQDSFELIIYVINQVYDEIRNHLNIRNDIQKWIKTPMPMRLLIQYTIVCDCEKVVYVPLHSDFALHVTIPLGCISDLQDLIDQHFQEDIIMDYKCDMDSCIGRNARKITKLISPLPRTICIHLQKSYWNGNRMKKIKSKIKFSKQLTIKSVNCMSLDYINSHVLDSMNSVKAKNILKSINSSSELQTLTSLNNSMSKKSGLYAQNKNNRISNSKISRNEKTFVIDVNKQYKTIKKAEKIFNLCSVIEHSGTVNGGHYICYKCIDNKWYLTDDFRIVQVKEENVLQCDPYILIYEKA